MDWFKMQTVWGASIERFSDAEAGRFIKAVYAYVRHGEEYDGGSGREDPVIWQALETLRGDIESFKQREANQKTAEEALKEKRRAAANARWKKQTDASASKCIREKASASTSIICNAFASENKSKNIEKEKEIIDNHGSSAGARANPFTVSDDEVADFLERDRQIEEAARRWGLPWNEGSMIQARDWARSFTLEWLLLAIETSGKGKEQTWRYVGGILKSWKENGGPDAPKKQRASPGKTVSAQAYQQREYTESELNAVSDDILAEARKRRNTA